MPVATRPNRQGTQQRVAIYCRVSSTSQEENASLPTQLAACRRHASSKRWDVVHEEQEVHTGADLHGRPGLRRVRDLFRQGKADLLLCYALDRLSRKQAHLAILADECAQAGVRLQFVTEEFENSAVGEFIRAAKAFAAEIEREKIIERTVRGKRARAESGRPIPGQKAPYGYQWGRSSGQGSARRVPIRGRRGAAHLRRGRRRQVAPRYRSGIGCRRLPVTNWECPLGPDYAPRYAPPSNVLRENHRLPTARISAVRSGAEGAVSA